MDCDGLTIAVHVLTLSAGLPDYCTSGGEAVCNRGWAQDFFFAQSRLITRKKKKNEETKRAQFVWAYGGTLSTLITTTAIGQKHTGKPA